jgi:hypothetical protein
LNIKKVLNLEISHPIGYPITTIYQITKGGEGIVTVENNKIIKLMASLPSQIGKYTLQIILTD